MEQASDWQQSWHASCLTADDNAPTRTANATTQ